MKHDKYTSRINKMSEHEINRKEIHNAGLEQNCERLLCAREKCER